MNAVRRQSGFTLIELLVVISILGILAALTLPALKNINKSNVSVSAARQLLDDVGRARQLAISQHTTVYMVFVNTNFWTSGAFNTNFFAGTPSMQPQWMNAVYNMTDKQLTGYTFMADGALGDQPGSHAWHILAPWQVLPDNTFIAAWKFQPQNIVTTVGVTNGQQYLVHGFNATNGIPYPPGWVSPLMVFPYIAFNYLGQLTVDGANPSLVDEYIPLAQGTVSYAKDSATKQPLMYIVSPVMIQETPPGNSTNSMFNLVHIDALTGRARLEFQQVQ